MSFCAECGLGGETCGGCLERFAEERAREAEVAFEMAGVQIRRCPCCNETTTFLGSNRCRACTAEGRLAPDQDNWVINVVSKPPTRFEREIL